jgi:copper oxidase (laccase) domain-containing protein
VHFDLWEANRRQLRDTGVPEDRIEIAGLCNACHPDLFFSHRRDHGRTGRYGMVAGIVDA